MFILTPWRALSYQSLLNHCVCDVVWLQLVFTPAVMFAVMFIRNKRALANRVQKGAYVCLQSVCIPRTHSNCC